MFRQVTPKRQHFTPHRLKNEPLSGKYPKKEPDLSKSDS